MTHPSEAARSGDTPRDAPEEQPASPYAQLRAHIALVAAARRGPLELVEGEEGIPVFDASTGGYRIQPVGSTVWRSRHTGTQEIGEEHTVHRFTDGIVLTRDELTAIGVSPTLGGVYIGAWSGMVPHDLYAQVAWRKSGESPGSALFVGPDAVLNSLEQSYQQDCGYAAYRSVPDAHGLGILLCTADQRTKDYIGLVGPLPALAAAAEYATYVLSHFEPREGGAAAPTG